MPTGRAGWRASEKVRSNAMRQRIAIVGLGMAVAPHAKSLMDLSDGVEVACAFSPSVARRISFGKSFLFPQCTSLDTILQDASIDAVAVLTPPHTHLDIVSRCAAAGKHVLLEKPVEITTARAQQLVAACRAAGVTLGIVLQHRHKPAVQRLADLMRGGDLGAPVGASASIRLWRPQSYYDEPGRGTLARDGGGVLITQAIHTLDVLLSLAGDPAQVMCFAATSPVHSMESEDLVCAAVRWRSGAHGVVEATTAAYPGAAERIDLITLRATATLLGTGLEVRWQDGRSESFAADGSSGGTGADPMAFPHDYHRSVWQDFVDALATGREPCVNGEEALRVHRLIDALLQSAASGVAVNCIGST